MSARKTINLKQTELHFLRDRIAKKYTLDEKCALVLNSNRSSYGELKRVIQKKLKGKVAFYISEYLLFKLYYETKYSSEASFNLDFINSLYLYLTEAKKNRYHYFNFSSSGANIETNDSIDIIKQEYEIKESKERDYVMQLEKIKTNIFGFVHKNKFSVVLFSIVVLATIITGYTINNSTYLHNHKGIYWVCKYEDGTKIWFRFTKTVNHNYAKNYFEGNLNNERIKCDAFKMMNNTRIPVCYDKDLARQYISEFGNVKCVYRE